MNLIAGAAAVLLSIIAVLWWRLEGAIAAEAEAHQVVEQMGVVNEAQTRTIEHMKAGLERNAKSVRDLRIALTNIERHRDELLGKYNAQIATDDCGDKHFADGLFPEEYLGNWRDAN